jgi:hypothetical protein
MKHIKDCMISLIKTKIKQVDKQLIIKETKDLMKTRNYLYSLLFDLEVKGETNE